MEYSKKDKGSDYSAENKKLKNEGPQRVYLLWGEEDYLVGYFLSNLQKACLPEGDNGFSSRRFNGPDLDLREFEKAVAMFPFLSERTFIEVHDVDINKLSDPDGLIRILSDVQPYCTVVFVQDAAYQPDGRTKFVKYLNSSCSVLHFVRQDQISLFKWIEKRFAANGKRISSDAERQLILVSGALMNRLIPEIDKISAYAPGELVTSADVNAVADKIPETSAFEMLDLISEKKFESALNVLSEVLKNKENNAIVIISALSYQLRRIYGVQLALKEGKRAELKAVLNTKFDFVVDKMAAAAGRFTSQQLVNALHDCVLAEYKMKSGDSTDDNELIKEIIIHMMTKTAYETA